jgi:antitoxin YefM
MYAFHFIITPKEKAMSTTNITELRKTLFKTVDSVIRFNEPVQVTTKNGNAVLISEADYDALLETVYLMSQPNLVSKIKEGEKENASEMSKFDPDEEW